MGIGTLDEHRGSFVSEATGALPQGDRKGKRKLGSRRRRQCGGYQVILTTAAKLHQEGRHEESLREIEELEKVSGNLPRKAYRQLLFLKADVLHDLGRFRDAVNCYERILAEKPSDVAYANKGLAYWELKEYQAALDSYQESIKLNPSNAIAQLGIGEMHIKLGDPKAALPFIEKALKLNPDYQEAYTCSGIALYQLGLWSRAYKKLQKAIQLDPDDWQAKKGIKLIEKHLDH